MASSDFGKVETGQALSERLQNALKTQATGLTVGGEVFTSEEVLASDGMLTLLLLLGFPNQTERNHFGMKWKASPTSLCGVELVELFNEAVLLEECQRRVAFLLQFWANRGGDLEDLYVLHKGTMVGLIDAQPCPGHGNKQHPQKHRIRHLKN